MAEKVTDTLADTLSAYTTPLTEMLTEPSDARSGVTFVTVAMVLGVHGYAMGKLANFVVGSGPLAKRILVNAVLLWLTFVALPWNYLQAAQNTLGGLMLPGLMFSVQSWSADFL